MPVSPLAIVGTSGPDASCDEEHDIEMKDPADEAITKHHDKTSIGKNSDTYEIIQSLSAYLSTIEEDGEQVAAGFQRIPNRRVLPDYFEVIPEPIAFSTIRGKIQKRHYGSFPEFVKDVAQICHNAQVYNRPSAPIFGAAVRLRDILNAQLQKLVIEGEISSEEAELPDLGDLPTTEGLYSDKLDDRKFDITDDDGEDIEDDDENDEDDEDEEDEDDEDEEDDEDASDVDEYEYRRKRPDRKSRLEVRRTDGGSTNGHKRRGRPPVILTPMEARISAIIRGLRKPKNETGYLIHPFEKLPDKYEAPDYYQSITTPIALNNIKKNAKRKKYTNVDGLMNDLELMFENAKLYNEHDSELYHAAVELQKQARFLAEKEKAKGDDEFRDEDGRLALSDIQYNGQIWSVGDWVHIRNPNDLAKPIVAQIFRTWQDRAGEMWINACWYYRPEQTVHRSEKCFYEHEVVKTGQYRDHQIADVLDQCFVMFVTRYNKGRPRGFATEKQVYVCESRYNEDTSRFNKIKTWASCLPDEVREKDYEMNLFQVPQRMRKVPSPIKHLLREDAKETDNLPKPIWGSPNAPPIVGAVHCRRPAPNESPLAPTMSVLHQSVPFAAAISAESAQHFSVVPAGQDARTEQVIDASFVLPPSASLPFISGQLNAPMASHSPATPMTSGAAVHQTPVPIPYPPQHHQAGVAQQGNPRQTTFQHHTSGYLQNHVLTHAQSPTPPMNHQSLHNSLAANYGNVQATPTLRLPTTSTGTVAPYTNPYNPPRPAEVYTLPGNLNESLPITVSQAFQHDTQGRVLFFTAPPLDRLSRNLAPFSAGIGHSVEYLAGREEWLTDRERKRKAKAGLEIDGDNVWATSRTSGPSVPKHTVDAALHSLSRHLNHETE